MTHGESNTWWAGVKKLKQIGNLVIFYFEQGTPLLRGHIRKKLKIYSRRKWAPQKIIFHKGPTKISNFVQWVPAYLFHVPFKIITLHYKKSKLQMLKGKELQSIPFHGLLHLLFFLCSVHVCLWSLFGNFAFFIPLNFHYGVSLCLFRQKQQDPSLPLW